MIYDIRDIFPCLFVSLYEIHLIKSTKNINGENTLHQNEQYKQNTQTFYDYYNCDKQKWFCEIRIFFKK